MKKNQVTGWLDTQLTRIEMSKSEFARRLGISAGSVSMFDKGTYRIPEGKLLTASRTLGVSIDEIERAQERRLLSLDEIEQLAAEYPPNTKEGLLFREGLLTALVAIEGKQKRRKGAGNV
jgi:transcriptional regulator with XRE-family HTH domain